MPIVKNARFFSVLLVVSLGANMLFVSFFIAAAGALANPQQTIERRVERMISRLPEQDKIMAQNKYSLFQAQYSPLLDDIRQERATFVRLLLASPVNVDEAKAEAGKLRDMTAKLQTGIQDTVVDIAAALSAPEKEKIVGDSRILKALAKEP